MDLKKFQQRVETRQSVPTPDACRNCPSLDMMRAKSGQLVLSCLVERMGGGQMTGPFDRRTNGGHATADWIRHALFTPEDQLDEQPGRDMGAVDFRKAVEAANETCPTMERMEGWLPDAPPDAIADLTPPAPILVYADLKIAIGLDGPKE